jgi:hypothetical protein
VTTPRLIQHFPWLGESDHRHNALHSLDMNSYLQLVSFVRNEPSMMMPGSREKLLSRGIDDPGTTTNPNKLHPISVFTPEWACSVMKAYGVPDSQCDMSVFKGLGAGDISWEFNIEEIDGAAAGAGGGDGRNHLISSKWYFPPQRSYLYMQEGWTWYRRSYAGLHMQYFPWVKVPDAIAKLAATRTESTALTLYEGDNDDNVLSKVI